MTGKLRTVLFLFIGILYLGCQHKEKANASQLPANSSGTATKEATITVNLDKSPLDMSYYPAEYPKLKMAGKAKEPVVARVIYSRPKKDGRVIFGDVLKYGSRWRLGANEATEIEFFKDVTIQNNLIKKNRYIVYCIPYENKWTIVFNNDLFTWGLKIDSTKDVYKFDIPVLKSQYPMEYFTMEFEQKDSGMQLIMEWDIIKTMLPITY
ncbi:MAG: DUF2911 domain-containing protein [Chitinophagaceae bacterium]|nr:DUF2911 domain-containing protein [Chitinophagaceae bacterium]